MKKLKERLISAFLVIVLAAEGISIPAYAMEQVQKQEITESIRGDETLETMEALDLLEEEKAVEEESEEKMPEGENHENQQLSYISDVATIYYGEDGSNKEGNLDDLFLPMIRNHSLHNGETEFTYRFFREGSEVYTTAQMKDMISEDQLLNMLKEEEGEELSEMEAGSKVIITVSAFNGEDKDLLYLVQGEIAKRELILVGKQDTLILEKDRREGLNTFCITPEMKEYGDFLLKAEGSGFVKTEELQNLHEVINGNITLKAEEAIEGEISVKAGLFAALSEAFETNYYITGDSFTNIMIVQEDEQESEADKEEIKEEELPIEEVSGNTTENEVSFTLNPSAIMYGESDNNETGTLDILFQPTYVVNQEEAVEAENEGTKEYESEYDTSYKFVTDKEKLETLTVDNFEQLEGERLSDIPAGTVVYVAAMASAENQPDVIAIDSFTVEKRKVLLHFEAPMEEAINEKSNPDEDKLVFEKEEAENYLTVEVVENQFNEEGISTFEPDVSSILSEDLLVSDVTLNLSEIDYEEIGYQEAPMTLELSEETIGNYEFIVDVVGYVYVEETIYYISFNVKNNGKTKELKYILDQEYLSETRSITEVLNHLGKLSEVTPTMGGFLEDNNDVSIVGWKISEAGNTWQTVISADFTFTDYEEENLAYPIEKRTDYYLTANLCKKASSNIYIDAIPAVTYDGRAHVVLGDSYTATKNANLQLWVKYVADGEDPSDGMYLRYGKDYKVTYKNNKEVSVKINEQGEYVPFYTEGVDDAKRPCAIVTGIGNYKGFSATVYFDILPLNFAGYPMAEISGLKNSYVLNSKGTITGGITPKVKLTHYYYTEKKNITKTYTLKLGKDYQQQLYLYENGRWKLCEESNPSKITKEGKYLYTIKGIGNYTGMYFGQEYYDIFNDGTEGEVNPQVSSYLGTDLVNCQFIVIGDASQDLANAKISIKKSQLNYKRNTYYTGADFGIIVTIGKGSDKRVLTEGVDYYITFDGTDFEYVQGRYNDGVYSMGISTEVYEGSEGNNARITIANRYKVTITALENNDNGIFGSKEGKSVRIKGIKIEPSWFKLSSPTLKYTGSNSASLKYRNNIRMKVSVAKPANILSFDSNGRSNFQQKKETLSTYAVFVFNNAYNKNPGTYESSVIPVGPGVDHDSMISVKFKRTGISTQEAFKKGILSISYDAADYNAGGSLPKNIVITLNGKENPCGDMKYNGQTFWVDDYYSGMSGRTTQVQLKLTVSNNKKTGNSAALYVQGDGTVFKGKSGKFTYSVSPITVSDIEIPVLTSDTYAKDFGKITQTVDRDGFYAKYEPVVKPVSGMPKHKITLYQTYYKNEQDYYSGRRSLAKLSNSQYKLTLTSDGSNGYQVDVGNSKAKIITGYDFKEVSIAENYTVFDKAATISQAIVTINGKEYNYPTDAKIPITFIGGQVRFDKNQGDGVSQVVLKDGTVLDADNFYVEYGDNVAAGKGSFTVILKRNSEGDYPYGGKATFNFTIGNAANVVL